MLSDSRLHPSFRTLTLVLCIASCNHVLADTLVVDDQINALNLSWHGSWLGVRGLPPELVWHGTLAGTNATGATATFTFNGTSVQVFGAFRPVGTWDMESLYSIDGGSPHTFTPPATVTEEMFGQKKFFDSGALPQGVHTLEVTNRGEQLWLDYFQFNDGTTSLPVPTSRTATITSTPTTSTTTTRPSSSSSSSSPADRFTPSSSGPRTATSSAPSNPSTSLRAAPSTSSPLATSRSARSLSSTPAVVSSLSSTRPPSSPVPLSNSSSSVTATFSGEETSQASSHAMPRTELVGLTVGIAVAGIALLPIILFRLRRRYHDYRRPTRSQARASQNHLLYPDRPDSDPFRSGDTQHSTTLSTFPSVARASSHFYRDSRGWWSSYRWPQQAEGAVRRSTDGGVSVAGGPDVCNAHAPSVSDAASEKSTLPPSYEELEQGASSP